MENNTNFNYHRGPVTCAVEIPNTSEIITASYDCSCAIFDWQTNDVQLLGYHQHLVNKVAVNTAGTLAATVSSDYNICIWDVQQKEFIRVLQGHSDDVEDFVFIEDDYGASVSRDRRIIVWNIKTGAIERIILGHEKDVLSVNYFEGRLYTSGDDMTLRSWDIKTGKECSKFGPFETETDTSAIDALNRRLVLGCDDGIVRVFSIDTSQLLHSMPGHSSGIKKVAVSPANGDILSAAYDQQIIIWDAQTLQLKQKLAHQSSLWERSFNWTQDGTRITAGTFDGTVLIWNADSGECIAELGVMSDLKGNACFNDVASMEDHRIATVSDDGLIRVGSLTEDEAVWLNSFTPKNSRTLMNAITYDSGNAKIIVGTHDQRIHCFTYVDEEVEQVFSAHLKEGPINSIRTSQIPESAGNIFIGCYSGAIIHLNSDGKLLHRIHVHNNAVKSLRLHPTKPLGISGSADGIMASWDYNGNFLRHYAGHTSIIDDIDLDPNGAFVASVGRDFTLMVHGVDDGILYHSIDLGKRSPKAVCFYDTNAVIVTNYWGELLRVSLDEGTVKRAVIAKNGISSIIKHDNSVVVTSYDGAIYLVDPVTLKIENSLRAMVQKLEEAVYA